MDTEESRVKFYQAMSEVYRASAEREKERALAGADAILLSAKMLDALPQETTKFREEYNRVLTRMIESLQK